MTRESGKSKIRMSVTVNFKHIDSLKKADEVIDKIYDDFEQQLKQAYINGSNSTNELIQSLYRQIEAKDCEGCKYKPNDGEVYLDQCGTCARFFYDHFEPKDK